MDHSSWLKLAQRVGLSVKVFQDTSTTSDRLRKEKEVARDQSTTLSMPPDEPFVGSLASKKQGRFAGDCRCNKSARGRYEGCIDSAYQFLLRFKSSPTQLSSIFGRPQPLRPETMSPGNWKYLSYGFDIPKFTSTCTPATRSQYCTLPSFSISRPPH